MGAARPLPDALPDSLPKPFRILAVCTGNVCRSPAVERLLAAGLPEDGVSIVSAGVEAQSGRTMTKPMAALVAGAGADPSNFVARQLTRGMVAEANLVLALTREHRAAVVTLHPGAVTITFTLRELGRLVADIDPADLPNESASARLTALLTLARNSRGLRQVPPREDDVLDPYGHDAGVYQQSFDELLGPVQSLLALF